MKVFTKLEKLEKANSIFGLYVYICRLSPNKFYGWYYTDIVDYLINEVAKIEWDITIAKRAKEMIEKYDENSNT